MDDDTPSLSTVVSQGDRRASLKVIRDKLAAELQNAEGKDAAPLAQRLVAVINEIESLARGDKESTVDKLRDDLAAKRARRDTATGP